MTAWSRIACAVTAVVLAALPATSVFASFTTHARVAQSVQSLTLHPPASVSVTTPDACGLVTVSWAANSDADGYRVQIREGSGPWDDAATVEGDVTSIEHAAGHVVANVTYRVYSRDTQSGWESETATESSTLAC
ncbi:MAG: hypothetical protein JWM90_3052 [Thermoleophilia bacterium]|nr:hypothetical protein [Thermoleophilia bacterium]